MELERLFKLKYELLEKLDSLEGVSQEEKELFRRGYEAAINAFFLHSLEVVLDPEMMKKSA